jgi:hypothetical protein
MDIPPDTKSMLRPVLRHHVRFEESYCVDPAIDLLQRKVENLRAENERLERLLRDYDERFIRLCLGTEGSLRGRH